MGEIATWSAVKTKVGLGKDSNECPTKAELLALSPTGTGENYVGLELTNASSYGNNETVQLSDIHKVTYKYVFTVENPTLTFTPAGGVPTPSSANIASTREKVLDGVATGIIERWSYGYPALPAWLTLIVDLGYRATENTDTSEREFTHTLTQQDSGKQLTITLTQAAGVETWEYTFSVQNPNLSYSALGGSATPEIAGYNTFKQRYINGKPVGTQVYVGFSSPDLPSWIFMDDEIHYTALENKSENSRSQVFTSTQNESGKKVTVTFTQAAGVKTYGTPTVYLGNIADIPASGGTAATPTYTYSQLWGWNGKTNDGGTISSGASVVWSENISGSNLGTTAKARTKLGSRTLTVTLNGKSGSASIDIYQAENKITNTSQGTWVVSISANPSTFTEQGGTSQISASASAPRTNHWSSGATNAASDATGTPTLSIPTEVTGFSLSGTTLTVAENTTANQRSVVVRATMDTVYKEITVTQSAYLVEWQYTFTASTPTLNFDALGTTKSGTISSYREKYINGSLVEGSHEGVNIQVKSTSAEIQSATAAVAITMKENTTTQARTGTVVYEQVGSGKTVTITCSQAAGTVAIREELVIKESFPTAPNIGGTVKALVRSGYWDVVNGKDTTWHDDTPTVKTKPSFVSSTSVTYELGVGYRISATMPENTSESQLSGSLNLEYGSKTLSLGVTQAGASVSYNYYIGFNGNPDVGGYSLNWEYTQFGSSHGQSIDLKCWRKPVINGIESDTEEAAEYEVIFSGVGIDSFTVTNTPLSYDPTITTVRAYPKSINGLVFDLKGTVQYRIADYPSKSAYLYLTHKPVATVKRWTFQWYDQVESVTIKNVSHDSSAGSISPITIISKCEYLLASNQSQVAYTEYIKPNEDEDTATPVSWGRLVENGQTAQNDYDYAYLVDENKEDYDRQATRTFTQPGNPSNKRLYLYVTQESPHTPEVAFDVYNSSLSASLLMGIGWRSNEGSDSLPNLSRGENLGAHGSNKSNIQVVYHAQPITTSQQWLPAAPSLKEFSYDGLPIALNGTDRYYNISEFQYGSSSASELFKVTVDNIDYDPTYGGSLTLQWEARLSNNKPTNGMYVGMIVLTPVRGNLPAIYVRLYYQSPSVKPSV